MFNDKSFFLVRNYFNFWAVFSKVEVPLALADGFHP